MSISRQLTDHAGSLFDVVGVTRLPDGDNLLVLGLESTPERDLDEFGHEGGRFRMYGFRKHVGPRLEPLVEFIRSKGFSAEPTGSYGYPLRGELSLKIEAERAGLGKRGKNTVVLHPVYGPRLRFMGVRTDAPLEPTATPSPAGEENPVCADCSICIDVCPVKVLEPYRMPDIGPCLSNITPRTEEGRSILCDLCLTECPRYRGK